MTTWNHTLHLGDIFHNDDLSFEEKRDEIVGRMRAARFYDPDIAPLVNIVAWLEEAWDANTFDQVWANFYDYADRKRIWVDTVSRRETHR